MLHLKVKITASRPEDVSFLPLTQTLGRCKILLRKMSTASVCFTWKTAFHLSTSFDISGLMQTLWKLLWSFFSGNQRYPEPGEEKLFCTQGAVSKLKVTVKKGPGGVRLTCTQKLKRELSTHAPCKNLFFPVRFAQHTCSCLAAPYFAMHTFIEQLKSFTWLCPG